MPQNTFDEACKRVLDDPEGSHSLYTTLAPLYDRMMADADDHYETQYDLLRERAPDARSVLEVGCGTGRLLSLLESTGGYDWLVGLDLHVELLEFATGRVEGAELVRGDATDCVLEGSFDAVCAFEYVTAHMRTDAEVQAFLDTATEHLQSGGIVVFDAVSDPVAVHEESVGVYRSSRYQLERAVDTVPAPDFPGFSHHTDYRITDRETGKQTTTSERMAIRTFGVGELEEHLTAAGFVDIAVKQEVGDEGTIVVVARRPET